MAIKTFQQILDALDDDKEETKVSSFEDILSALDSAEPQAPPATPEPPGMGAELESMGALPQEQVRTAADVDKPGIAKTAAGGVAGGMFGDTVDFFAKAADVAGDWSPFVPDFDFSGAVAPAVEPAQAFRDQVLDDRATAGGNPIVTGLAETVGELGDSFVAPVKAAASAGISAAILAPNLLKTIRKGGVKQALKQVFSPGGNVGRPAVDLINAKNAIVHSQVLDAQALERTLGAEVKRIVKAEGVDAKNIYEGVDKGLRGADSAVHPELKPLVESMRKNLDGMSSQIADTLGESGMADVIRDNMGEYLHRSYKRFNQPGWVDEVQTTPAWDNAFAYFKKEFPDLADDQIEGELIHLASNEADFANFASGKGKEILKSRKNIPPELKALMGEELDPGVNYVRSVTKMATRLETRRMVEELRASGIETGIMPANRVGDAPVAVRALGGEDGIAAPFASQAVADELEYRLGSGMIDGPGFVGTANQAVRRAVSGAKSAKTVLSLPSAMRNHWSSAMLYLGRGGSLIPNKNHFEAFKTTAKGSGVFAMKGDSTSTAVNAYNEAVKFGVAADSSRAREFEGFYNMAVSGVKDGRIDTTGAGKWGKFMAKAVDFYQFGDDFWKVSAWSDEMSKYRHAWEKAGKEFTEDQLKEHAAKLVRDTMPTYSLVPQGVDALRYNPYVGPFPSFSAEVARNLTNTINLGLKEWRDPVTKRIGAQRLAGAATAFTLPKSVAVARSSFDFGESAERQESARPFMPFWAQNSQSPMLSEDMEAGTFSYLDTSFIDPYQPLKAPFIAALNSDGVGEGFTRLVEETLSQFVGTELLPQRGLEALSNRNAYGKKISSDNDPGERLRYLLWSSDGEKLDGAFIPGTAPALKRMAEDPSVKTLASFFGMRIQEVDVKKELYHSSMDMAERTSGARKGYRRSIENGDPAGILEARQAMDAEWEEIRAGNAHTVEMARKRGLDDNAIFRSLVSGGVSMRHARGYLSGQHFPILTQPEDESLRAGVGRNSRLR